MQIVFLASDHNGVKTKEAIKQYLKTKNIAGVDLGPTAGQGSVDYVDYAKQLATVIGETICVIGNKEMPIGKGILICGTGVGMSVVANKTPGVRAALVHNRESAIKSREHNDANVICLSSWINSDEENINLVNLWLNQSFGEHRHVKRIEKIDPQPLHKIIFANGVFDILHHGHIQLLKFARLLGDHLIVGLNSDRSVKEWKGPDRPINDEKTRKAVLEANRFVDEVIIFDEVNPSELIRKVNPHVVVRGGEYTADEIRQRDKIPDHIQVKIFPISLDVHTSSIINQIKGVKP